MKDKSVGYIIDEAIKGNELPFNHFFEETYSSLEPKLIAITKSKEVSKEVFIISMQKFWECFVINKKVLPHNSIGYIYSICKNIWLLQKKKRGNMFFIQDQKFDYFKEETNEPDIDMTYNYIQEEKKHLIKHKALAMSIESLSHKCKTLIETVFNSDLQLKDLQETLGFNSYQALVQAKYNCKKRLIKKVYEILIKLEQQPYQTDE